MEVFEKLLLRQVCVVWGVRPTFNSSTDISRLSLLAQLRLQLQVRIEVSGWDMTCKPLSMSCLALKALSKRLFKCLWECRESC